MSDPDDMLDVVGDIYDCAVEPKRWEPTLQRLCKVVGLASAGIVTKDPTRNEFIIRHGWGGRDEYRRQYRETYFKLNPVNGVGWIKELDEPFTCSEINGRESWLRSRMYLEWMAPQGWLDAAGLNIAKSTTRRSSLSAIRSQDQGWFTDGTLDRLRILNRHVRRAVSISDMLCERNVEAAILGKTLDLLTVGVLLVDKHGRLVFANALAREQLDRGQPLRRSGDLVIASDPVAARGLTEVIEGCARKVSDGHRPAGAAVPLAGPEGTEFAAWVLPLTDGLRAEIGQETSATIAIFIKQIGSDDHLPGELFVKRYGVTPAECSVLMQLVHGHTPSEVADVLGLSLATVKTHMARLFAKTGTRGQADLMRLAMSCVGPALRR
jgi:DNA-binding CsgD family transcriptional regulator